MSKVLFIVGSLRQESFNKQLAQQVEHFLIDRVKVNYLDYGNIPIFNQDLETPVLPAVSNAREAVMMSDAVWIFSPVYNHSIPGSVKNLLDWLSRSLDLSDTRGPSVLQDKLITLSSVSSKNSLQNDIFSYYRDLLLFIRTKVINPFVNIGINSKSLQTKQLVIGTKKREEIKQQVEAVLSALQNEKLEEFSI